MITVDAENVAAFASLATASLAFVGLVLAFVQIRASREISAQNAYETYHHLSLQYPSLSSSRVPWRKLEFSELEQYEWFVLSMLLTVERIMTLFPSDVFWRAALVDDVEGHIDYLRSERFAPHMASLHPRVVQLIKEVDRSTLAEPP